LQPNALKNASLVVTSDQLQIFGGLTVETVAKAVVNVKPPKKST